MASFPPGALFKMAQSTNPVVAQAAVGDLLNLGSEAVPVLVKNAREAAPQVRILAIQILGAMGPAAESAEADLRAMMSDPYLGQAAADAVNKIVPGAML
jgi:hypothetical protein